MSEIYFAGGCFWGIQKAFSGVKGVVSAECGYAMGRPNIVPTYEKVCTGKTGYRETVRVEYDPAVVTLDKLLEAFFYIIDPTQQDGQGDDIGKQYRTGIYWSDDESAMMVSVYVMVETSKHKTFFTEIGKVENYHPAEEYHQNYLDKNPGTYCYIPPRKFAELAERMH